MKQNFLFKNLFILLFIYSNITIAQTLPSSTRVSSSTTEEQANLLLIQSWRGKDAVSLLREYEKKYISDSFKGKAILDTVHARGLETTPSHVAWIQKLLGNSAASAEEKEVLIHILGYMYIRTSDEKLQKNIEKEVRSHLNNSNDVIARSAVMTYSRMEYFDDTIDALKNARKRNIIDDDTAFGDMAHLINFADSIGRFRMLNEIEQSKSKFAADLVAANYKDDADPRTFKNLTRDTAEIISKILEKNEPQFQKNLSLYGGTATYYSNWLLASANIRHFIDGTSKESFIEKQLMAPNVDPRKVLAYVEARSSASPHSFQAKLKTSSKFEKHLKDVVESYGEQYPDKVSQSVYKNLQEH